MSRAWGESFIRCRHPPFGPAAGRAIGCVLVLANDLAGHAEREAVDAVVAELSRDTAVDVWAIAKWPVLLVLVSLLLAILYWGAPNVKVPFRLISPGSLLAVVGWVIASLLFAFYVSNFGSYNKTYGALAGPIIFLLWLWITNICVLLGAELNAQLQQGEETSA